jgi:hypothetical protein
LTKEEAKSAFERREARRAKPQSQPASQSVKQPGPVLSSSAPAFVPTASCTPVQIPAIVDVMITDDQTVIDLSLATATYTTTTPFSTTTSTSSTQSSLFVVPQPVQSVVSPLAGRPQIGPIIAK